jgi:hypothetical protein
MHGCMALALAIFLLACAAGPIPPAGQMMEGQSAERSNTAGSGATAAVLRGTSELPEAALDLLAQSARDSCSICAERNRKEAFEQLDAFYAPGVLITSEPGRTFLPSAKSPLELALSSYARETPMLTLRFHTMKEHLVGVDTTDYSDEAWVAFLASNPGMVLDGTIQLIAYPYGDGPTYLYSQAENHLQLQCRVLELNER